MTSIQPTYTSSFEVTQGKPHISKQSFYTADAYNGGGCLLIAGKLQGGEQNAVRIRYVGCFCNKIDLLTYNIILNFNNQSRTYGVKKTFYLFWPTVISLI